MQVGREARGRVGGDRVMAAGAVTVEVRAEPRSCPLDSRAFTAPHRGRGSGCRNGARLDPGRQPDRDGLRLGRPHRHLRPRTVVGGEHLIVAAPGGCHLPCGNDEAAVEEAEVDLGREPPLPLGGVRADVGAREDGGGPHGARGAHRLRNHVAPADVERPAKLAERRRRGRPATRRGKPADPRRHRTACSRSRRRARRAGARSRLPRAPRRAPGCRGRAGRG